MVLHGESVAHGEEAALLTGRPTRRAMQRAADTSHFRKYTTGGAEPGTRAAPAPAAQGLEE